VSLLPTLVTNVSVCYIQITMSGESERRSRREERKAETRAELIGAAARVFARRGYHGASIDLIAAQAGYTRGAIYWHFSGKDDLFLAVYETYAATRVRELEEISSKGGDLVGNARAMADQWMARARATPEFLALSLEFIVHAWRNPKLGRAFANRDAAVPGAIGRMLTEQAAAEELALPMPAEELALALRELGAGLAFAALPDPQLIREDLFGDVVALFFELLRKHGQALSAGRTGGQAGS
jgi:AcrR family transcriptional regulator